MPENLAEEGIVCLSLGSRALITSSGARIPVICLYSEAGEVTDDVEEAFSFTADAGFFGKTPGNRILLPCDMFAVLERSTIH